MPPAAVAASRVENTGHSFSLSLHEHNVRERDRESGGTTSSCEVISYVRRVLASRVNPLP